jgi:hypothetical protein
MIKMSLTDKTKTILNGFFSRVTLPITIKEIVFYRIALDETYYDNFEPIHDIVRFDQCSPIYTNMILTYEKKEYEYLVTYTKNNDNELKTDNIKLKSYDYTEGEDYKNIEIKMIPTINLIAKGLIPQIMNTLKKS